MVLCDTALTNVCPPLRVCPPTSNSSPPINSIGKFNFHNYLSLYIYVCVWHNSFLSWEYFKNNLFIQSTVPHFTHGFSVGMVVIAVQRFNVMRSQKYKNNQVFYSFDKATQWIQTIPCSSFFMHALVCVQDREISIAKSMKALNYKCGICMMPAWFRTVNDATYILDFTIKFINKVFAWPRDTCIMHSPLVFKYVLC